MRSITLRRSHVRVSFDEPEYTSDVSGLGTTRILEEWQRHVRLKQRYLRPAEVDDLVGDPSITIERLGWQARPHTSGQLLALMVDADVRAFKASQARPTPD